MLKKSEYHKILDSFGQADCGTLTNELRVNFSNELNRQVLETLSLLRNKYLPAFVHLSPRGKRGQYFSVWEGMGLRWFELDELNIEWHTLDAL